MIKIGPGGSGGRGYEEGLRYANELGFLAFEVEFTHGVSMSDKVTTLVKDLSKKYNISLSCHAPYYVNLCSKENDKIIASEKRIIDSAKKLDALGGGYVVFHAGYYQDMSKDETYSKISDSIKRIQKQTDKLNVTLAPETTGKATQFGDLQELLKLRQELGIELCIDFSHLIARNNGNINYDDVFSSIKKIPHIHSHLSGIEWTSKGEKKHIPLKPDFLLPIAKLINKNKTDITIICESPDMYGDAKMILDTFNKLKGEK